MAIRFNPSSGGDDRIADLDLKLMQTVSEHLEIPEQHCKAGARLPSAEFQRYAMTLKELGETMECLGIAFPAHR